MKEKDFKTWYSLIPQSAFRDVRNDIMTYCGVTKDVLATWANGRVQVPHAAKPLVNFVATKHKLDEPFEDVEFQITEKL